jgi:hypothetical protein
VAEEKGKEEKDHKENVAKERRSENENENENEEKIVVKHG